MAVSCAIRMCNKTVCKSLEIGWNWGKSNEIIMFRVRKVKGQSVSQPLIKKLWHTLYSWQMTTLILWNRCSKTVFRKYKCHFSRELSQGNLIFSRNGQSIFPTCPPWAMVFSLLPHRGLWLKTWRKSRILAGWGPPYSEKESRRRPVRVACRILFILWPRANHFAFYALYWGKIRLPWDTGTRLTAYRW